MKSCKQISQTKDTKTHYLYDNFFVCPLTCNLKHTQSLFGLPVIWSEGSKSCDANPSPNITAEMRSFTNIEQTPLTIILFLIIVNGLTDNIVSDSLTWFWCCSYV